MFWCFRALQASVLWSLIASQPPLCGENEVEVGHSGLSKAQSHCSQSGALTPSRFLMDFRRHRQTHSWAPNKLIRAPQICSSPIDPRTHPHNPASRTLFLYLWQAVIGWKTVSSAILCTSEQQQKKIYSYIIWFSIKSICFPTFVYFMCFCFL